MKKLIVTVTGIPGTGKTYFARRLAASLRDSSVIEINYLVGKHKLFSKRDKFGTRIVDLGRLNKAMSAELAKKKTHTIIVVGHLAPELKFNSNLAIVTRCGLIELSKRLKKRKYEKEKAAENLIAEATDYCGLKMMQKCTETYEIENDSEKRKMISYVKKVAEGKTVKKPTKKEINNFGDLLELIKKGNKYGL
jgi:broad-specificity NMP kinase